MENIKCLIVDDEIPATKVLNHYCNDLPGLDVIAICHNSMEALQQLRKESIDLIFLDIQMPGLSGLEFLKTLNGDIPVILTTAYREYAVEGYEFYAIDYLVKPISFKRFFKAINKVMNPKLSSPFNNQLNEEQGIIDTVSSKSIYDHYIYVSIHKKMQQVWLKDIDYIQSIGAYVKIKTKQNVLITHTKIGYLEKKLPSSYFLRVHRSYIVAISKISSFNATSIELGDINVPIGVSYRENVSLILSKNII